MRKYLILIAIISFFGCEKAFLGDSPVNSPEENFDLFWNDFNEHYGLLKARNLDWDNIYTIYRPQVTPQTTEEELWVIFKEMIDYLDDSHTWVGSPRKKYMINGVEENFHVSGSAEHDRVAQEFSLDLLREKYIENIKEYPAIHEGHVYLTGNLKNKDIGYIYMSDMLAEDYSIADQMIQDLKQHKAIVFDIRNNIGGADETGQAFAGRFADSEQLVYSVQEKIGPNRDDFAEKTLYHSKILGTENFTKPVILLTDQITVSAAEVFMIYMKSFEHVTQIGDFTSGDFSDTGMRRFLPNGWQYSYSIMMFLLPDGSSLDGIGHEPDVMVRNAVTDIESGTDKVVEKTITYLFEEHGIE